MLCLWKHVIRLTPSFRTEQGTHTAGEASKGSIRVALPTFLHPASPSSLPSSLFSSFPSPHPFLPLTTHLHAFSSFRESDTVAQTTVAVRIHYVVLAGLEWSTSSWLQVRPLVRGVKWVGALDVLEVRNEEST